MSQTTKLKLINIYDHSDLAFTCNLRNDNREFFFNPDHIDWFSHCQWLSDKNRQKDFEFFIIWVGRKRAGTIAVEHRDSCNFLQNLCISSEYRGRGLAKWAIQQLMKKGKFTVAQVKPDNKKVIKMYTELGFWRVK
jgi:ribosomal protein S18 acetylase RimI-like enzyme